NFLGMFGEVIREQLALFGGQNFCSDFPVDRSGACDDLIVVRDELFRGVYALLVSLHSFAKHVTALLIDTAEVIPPIFLADNLAHVEGRFSPLICKEIPIEVGFLRLLLVWIAGCRRATAQLLQFLFASR